MGLHGPPRRTIMAGFEASRPRTWRYCPMPPAVLRPAAWTPRSVRFPYFGALMTRPAAQTFQIHP